MSPFIICYAECYYSEHHHAVYPNAECWGPENQLLKTSKDFNANSPKTFLVKINCKSKTEFLTKAAQTFFCRC